jgi:hypothetical protein
VTNIPPDVIEQIRQAIQRPEGTFRFEYTSEQLTQPGIPGGIIFELPAGGHVFRLERTADLLLNFFHSSPGTGTRIATVDLKTVPQCTRALIAFTWSPTDTQLYFGPRIQGAQLLSATGKPSRRQLRVGRDGAIYQVGGDGVDVVGASIDQAGVPILQPTALDAWQQTVRAAEILKAGESPDGYIFEVVVANLTLSVLVTGFEAYTKTRFTELEKEGVRPNIDQLVAAFFSKRERERDAILDQEAASAGTSMVRLIVESGAINFQSYGSCKRAYNKGFGIKFGEIGLTSTDVGRLQRLLKYRHRVVHVSPLLAVLNQADVPPEEPEFANKRFAQEAAQCFNAFVSSLHEATLTLRRCD